MTTHIDKDHKDAKTGSSCCAHDSNHSQRIKNSSDDVTDDVTGNLEIPEEHEKSTRASLAEGAVLEELKNEILMGIKGHRRAPLSWGSAMVSVVLVVLAVLSVLQTVQTASLYSKLKSGDFKPAATASPAGAAQGLPNQVGGC